MIYVSHALDVNVEGEPTLDRSAVWDGLVLKANNALPFVPSMTECYYPSAMNLVEAVLAQLDIQPSTIQQQSIQKNLIRPGRHDVPHLNFVGPF